MQLRLLLVLVITWVLILIEISPAQTAPTQASKCTERSDGPPKLLTNYVVLDHDVARSMYGSEIAGEYFVVSVTVVNKDPSKASLQYVQFCNPESGKPPIGTVPLDKVIQTYERRRVKGGRARAVQALTVVSLVAPTFEFFFKAEKSRATFTKSLGIYNSGRTGIFDTFPDYLQTYLQLLRGNKLFTKNFEIAPSTSDSVDVFLLKDSVLGRMSEELQKTNTDLKKLKSRGPKCFRLFGCSTEIEKLPSVGLSVNTDHISGTLGQAEVMAFAPASDQQLRVLSSR